ncbi:F-box/kelch-repeat protein At3g06240-like [Papaver somniferum]|uniref:F-box/kelch-repeat protein At3g06240-like n=1 Tax=Papaver somniferum TaxID=3469 RepID=UPI000E6FC00B|nr:F-box/kelch-repeat protein At3g06240-like [Papaver somniferum]
MSTNILLSLPKEVITMEILSRLPVKSILRFRSVCKTFVHLFSDLGQDEEFVKLHLSNALNNNYLNIMLTGDNQIYSVDYFDASSCKINAIEIDYPFKSHLIKEVHIWGSCNGLLCLGIKHMEDECICFWNPSTNEYKRIPTPPEYIMPYGQESYGFGYDCANDDYKLVSLMFEINTAVVNNMFMLRR